MATARSFICGLFSFSLLHSASGQVLIELGRTADKLNAYSGINVYGSEELKNNVTYDRISGSPFLDDTWRSALLYDHQQRSFGKWKVKLNLVTQEIHFLDSLNQERTIGAQYVQKILYTDSLNDNAEKVFIGGIPDMVKQEIKQRYNYYLQCNRGHTILLKNIRRVVKSADSMFGTLKRYYFHDEHEYFIQNGNQYHRLNRLNKDEFFKWIPGASLYSDWIKKEKLYFKKEQDFIRFLEYYNNTYSKED